VQEEAAIALSNLARDATARDMIASAGAIPMLVSLLGETSSGSDGQAAGGASGGIDRAAKAAAAISNLAECNASNKRLVLETGAHVRLIELLGSDSPLAQEQVALALTNLAVDPNARQQIAGAGACGPLVAMLCGGGDDSVLWQAAAALTNLACENEGNERRIVAAGAARPLVALLGRTAARLQKQAAAALWNVAGHAEAEAAIGEAGAIAPLVALERTSSDEGVRTEAAGALESLAAADENAKAIAAMRALEPPALQQAAEKAIAAAAARARSDVQKATQLEAVARANIELERGLEVGVAGPALEKLEVALKQLLTDES